MTIDKNNIRVYANDLVKNNRKIAYGLIVIPMILLFIINFSFGYLDNPYLSQTINLSISLFYPFVFSIIHLKILRRENISFIKSFSLKN